MLVSESEEYGKLFNELLVILEPLMHIPFSFSVDFELRQVHEWYCGGICVKCESMVWHYGGVCVRVWCGIVECMCEGVVWHCGGVCVRVWYCGGVCVRVWCGIVEVYV